VSTDASQLNWLQQGQDQIPELLTCSNQFGDTVQALAFIIAELERRCCNILFEMLQ